MKSKSNLRDQLIAFRDYKSKCNARFYSFLISYS